MSTEQQTNGSGNGNGGNQSRAIVKSPKERQSDFKLLLDKARPQIAAVLPKHVTIDRIMRIVLSATSKTPQLLLCNQSSLLLAILQAASLGLEPNTSLGLSYLIPYGKEVQFIPSYKGLIRLALQSGEVVSIESTPVFKNEHFEVKRGTASSIDHEIMLENAGDIRAVYAVATMKNGSKVFEVMSIEQIEAIRERSKAKDSGPWKTDYIEMARKTVIRRLCKILPLSEEKLARAMEQQARTEAGDAPDYGDIIDVVGEVEDPETGEMKPAQSRTDAIAERLTAKAEGKAS